MELAPLGRRLLVSGVLGQSFMEVSARGKRLKGMLSCVLVDSSQASKKRRIRQASELVGERR